MNDTRPRAEILAELETLRSDIQALGRWHHHTEVPGDAFGFSQTVERFRELIRSLGIWLLEIDPQGVIVGCGTMANTLLGREGSTLIGLSLSNLVHPDEKIALESLIAREHAQASGRFRIRHDNGNWLHFDLQISSESRPDAGGPRLIFARDVSAESAAINGLRTSQERYRTLTENMTDLIVEIDSTGRFLYASPNSKELLGYTPEQLLNSDVETILGTGRAEPTEQDELIHEFRRHVLSLPAHGRAPDLAREPRARLPHTDGRGPHGRDLTRHHEPGRHAGSSRGPRKTLRIAGGNQP